VRKGGLSRVGEWVGGRDLSEGNGSCFKRYMQELKKELKKDEELYPKGFVFDFTKPKGELKEKPKDHYGIKILEVGLKD
jgi:hypothetical protein